MPFYIRKSVSAGPFRFNLSKGGLGLSAGVRGLRVGTGPRGHYVHAGRGGLYYRKTLKGKQPNRTAHERRYPAADLDPERGPAPGSDVEMVAVSSGAVSDMEDARFAEILAEMDEKQRSTKLSTVLLWVGVVLTVIATVIAGVPGFIVGAILTAGARYLGSWLDESRRSVVMVYDLEDDAMKAYEAMTGAFDRLAACQGKWHDLETQCRCQPRPGQAADSPRVRSSRHPEEQCNSTLHRGRQGDALPAARLHAGRTRGERRSCRLRRLVDPLAGFQLHRGGYRPGRHHGPLPYMEASEQERWTR